MKICLVTPDIIGPIKNGGIGTYAFHLTELLNGAGHNLAILFTSVPEKNPDPDWRRDFADKGIPFLTFEELPPVEEVPVEPQWEWFMERSWRIYQWLKDQDFDLVHFQDWGGNGFYSIQAKRTGLAFSRTQICVTLHSPTSWCSRGMGEWPENTFRDLRLSYCERFCAEYADYTISPSQHMLDWAENEGWRPRGKSLVLQNPFTSKLEGNRSETESPDCRHVIFFGRLEARKGVEVFCQALNDYLRLNPDPFIRKVTFIGKEMTIKGIPSSLYLQEALAGCTALDVEVKMNLNAFEAQEYIRQSQGVVFIPSLLDNFPYTLVECIEQGFPLFCSNSGGMGEICDQEKTFQPTSSALVEIFEGLPSRWKASRHQYASDDANERLLRWHQDREEDSRLQPTGCGKVKISVVISYYNHAAFLENMLESLVANDCEGHEVLIVNDGSTCPESREVFQKLSTDPRFAHFQFYDEQINRGLADARNFLVEKATGEWLLFHDTDNCALPSMLADFSRAISVAEAEILVCHYSSFEGEYLPGEKIKPYNFFRPYGNFTVMGLFENVFGDANFAVSRAVFSKMGGFNKERANHEDWHFLLRAAIEEREMQVIPKVLYWYRRAPQSLLKTRNKFECHMNVLQAYFEHADPFSRALLRDVAIPLYYEHYRLGKAWSKLNKSVQKLLLKNIPNPSPSSPQRKKRKFFRWK